MRDTPDAVRMAEKLVASIDMPEPEVLIEVEVLEIARSKLLNLGITPPQLLHGQCLIGRRGRLPRVGRPGSFCRI